MALPIDAVELHLVPRVPEVGEFHALLLNECREKGSSVSQHWISAHPRVCRHPLPSCIFHSSGEVRCDTADDLF